MTNRPEFIFVTCHAGAEAALKAEIARNWPAFRFSFSRPGFVTFKLPAEQDLVDDFDLRSTFAQAYGFSLGRVSGGSLESRAEKVWQIVGQHPAGALHVWQRDLFSCQEDSSDPGISPEAAEARHAIRIASPDRLASPLPDNGGGRATRESFAVVCVLVERDVWWVGFHRVKDFCWR